MEIKGLIHKIYDTQIFESGFQKREFVINTGGDYPQMIKCELIKDKCSLLDNYEVGQDVSVSINIRGSYHEPSDRYFVNILAWKMDKVDGAPQQEVKEQQTFSDGSPAPEESGDSLPF